MTRVLAVAIAAVALILLPATAANAAFRAGAWATTTVATGTLAPPTGLANGSSCNIVTQNLSVSWTAPARVSGYTVLVTVGGTTSEFQPTPATATSFSRLMLLGSGKTYTVSVRVAYFNWTAVSTPITFVC